jgi:sugar diacid utilization regulator
MDSLSHQLRIVEQARSTQTTLSQLLLGGEGVDSIIRAIGLQLDARIVLLSSQLEVLSTWPRALRVDDIVERLRSGTSLDSPNVGDLSVELEPGRWLTAQPVRTRSDHRGWFCAVLPEPPGVGEELVIGEAVTVIALCQVMERAAEEARIGERQTLVWDLIEGPIGQRRAAVDRARWLRVDLDRVRRLIRAEIHPTGSSRRERWDEADYEQARYRVLTKVRAAAIKSGAGDFVAMRGNELAVIVNDAEPTILRRLVATLDDAAGEVLQWHKVAWGVSSSCQTLLDLDQANREAISAVRAAVRLGLDELMYEDLGVAGLIVSDDDGDLSSFLRDVIGPLVEHDVERRSELVDTLRAYFAVDYSHRHAAERLHIHHKTFRYRLGKIERLTGLDLRSHEGRMRADLALKLLDVTAGDAMPVAETSPSGAPSKTRQR